jgi:hypothetical protein
VINQRFTFAGLHFGDTPLVEHDPTDQLDPVGSLTDRPNRGFTHDGISLGQEIVQGFSLGQTLFEFIGLGAEFIIAQ